MAKMSSTSKPVHVLINKYPDLEADVIEQVFLNNRCQRKTTEKYLKTILGAVPRPRTAAPIQESSLGNGGRMYSVPCSSNPQTNCDAAKKIQTAVSNATSSRNSAPRSQILDVEESDEEVIEIQPRDQIVTPPDIGPGDPTNWMTADSLRGQWSTNNQRQPLLSYYDLYKPPREMTCHLGVKRLILLRGLPGSGKSTRAKDIQQQQGGVIFSTDQYFVDKTDGSYHFQNQLLGRAHLWNRTRSQNAAAQGVSPIIIDNTNTMMKEMKPYIGIARHFGYIVEIEEMKTPWAMNPADLARRNIHGVDETMIRVMKNRYQHMSTNDVMSAFCRMPSPNNFKYGTTMNDESSQFTSFQSSALSSLPRHVQKNELQMTDGPATEICRPTTSSGVSGRYYSNEIPAVVIPKQTQLPPKLKPVNSMCDHESKRLPQQHKVQDWMTAQLSNLSVTAEEFQPTASTFIPRASLSANQLNAPVEEQPANDDERTLLSIFPNQSLENVRNLLIGNNGDMDASIEVLCDLTDEISNEQAAEDRRDVRSSTNECLSGTKHRTEAFTVVSSLKSLALKVVDQALCGSSMGPDALLIINSSMSVHEKSQMNSLGTNVKSGNVTEDELTYIDILDSDDSDDDDANPNHVTVIHNDVTLINNDQDMTIINNDLISSTFITAPEDNAADNVCPSRRNLSSTLQHTNLELPAFYCALPPELTSHLIELFGTFPSWDSKPKVRMDRRLLAAIYEAWKNTPYADEQMLVEEKDADDCIYSLPGASARVADSNLLQQQPSIVDLTSPVKPTPCSFKTNELNLIDISNSSVGSPATSERSIGTSPKAKKQKRTKCPRLDLTSQLTSGQTSTKHGETCCGRWEGGISLQEIMDEEERAQKSEEAQQQAFSLAASMNNKQSAGESAADLLKTNTLRMLFPDLQENILTTVLQDFNYSLKDSVQILSMQFGEPSQERLASAKTNPLWNDATASHQTPSLPIVAVNPEPVFGATANPDRSFQTLVRPDYVDYRAESNMYRVLRQRELEKAMNATGPDKSAKKEHYARNAFEYGELMKEANQRAALLTLEQNKEARGGAFDVLDLHRLHVEEALVAVKNHLAELTHPKLKGRYNKLRIITGWGKSTIGPARIKPEVIKLLRKERLNFVMENKGAIVVFLK